MPEQTDTAVQDDITITGVRGTIVVRRWESAAPVRVVVLAHGYGEHSGRYRHVAEHLVADGAVVYAPDHHGHGRSDGEPGLVSDVEKMVDDLGRVVDLAVAAHPTLPVGLLGHSLGGVIATRYAQRGDERLSALVLTGPVIGGNPAFEGLLAMDPMPDVPIDPAILSRDETVGQRYVEDPLVYNGPLTRPTLEGIFAAVATIREGGDFGELPTLWLHGEDDQLAPLEATRPVIERVGGSSLTQQTYPGARHEILNETNQDEIIATVSDFFAAHLPAAVV